MRVADLVTGFKEIRYVCGKYLPPAAASACLEYFHGFLTFLRSLCQDVKLIFNSRAEATLEQNDKLFKMDIKDFKVTMEDFMANLVMTHTMFDNYAKAHPDHAFRVHMEDMYNPKKNKALARELLSFLGENTTTHISFTRMPGWE